MARTGTDSTALQALPRWWAAVLVALALLLHLPAHAGPGGRTPLFEDGPALTANPAFEAFGTETGGDVIRRALTDPAAPWGEGEGAVGRERFRPLAHALYAIERQVGGTGAHRLAGVVGLVALVVASLATMHLASRCGLGRGPALLAGALVAAAPSGMASADWAARHAAAVAAALGGLGLLGTASVSAPAIVAGAVALAAAGLTHEFAFGLAVAAPFVRATALPGRARGAWIAVTCAAAAFAWRSSVLSSRADVVPEIAMEIAAPQSLAGSGVIGAAVGPLRTLVAAVLPARHAFADSAWTVPAGLGLLALLAIVLFLVVVARAPRGAARSLWGGAVVSAVATTILLWRGGVQSSDEHVFLLLPVAACAIAACVSAGLRGPRDARMAAAACGALLVAASAASTITASSAFRSRDAHAALALRGDPRGVVPRAWALAASVQAAGGSDALARVVRDAVPEAIALSARVEDVSRPPLVRDAVTAVTLAGALRTFSVAVARPEAAVAPADDACDPARIAAQAAAKLLPLDPRSWVLLASACERQGNLREASDACVRALGLAPDNLDVLQISVRVALGLGQGGLASGASERMLELERAAARSEGRAVRGDILLTAAAGFAADGAHLMSDPDGDGLIVGYEAAAAILTSLSMQKSDRELAALARARLVRTYVIYGDMLASEDRTALAMLAYAKAAELEPRDLEAKQHGDWLFTRLAAEERAAGAALDSARRGVGNVADALVAFARVRARQARFDEAKALYEQIEQQAGTSPELRYHRAVELWAVVDPARARSELAAVAAERPLLGRPSFELAKLLEREGDIDGALAAYRQAVDRADRTALTGAGDGADDWVVDALDREQALQLLKLAGTPDAAPGR